MFCPKCGTKVMDGAVFCQKCGAKLTADTSATQSVPESASSPERQSDGTPKGAGKKKKSKKLVIGIAVAVVVVFVAILIASSGGDDDAPNLFQIAEAVSPMTEFGFNSTYGDVFDWLIANDKTSLKQDGDVAYLTFSGNVTGGDYPVAVVLKMTGLSVNATNQRLEPYAMTLNGTEVPDFNNPEGMLTELFWGEKNKADYPTFMDFVTWDTESGIGTFDRYFDGLNSGENMFTTAVASSEEAQRLVESWLNDHPIGGAPSVDEAAANDVDSSISEAHFIFELWSDPRSYAGLVYVRKSDGYMSFQPADSEGMMGLDDWYDLWLSDDVIIGGDGLTSPSAESITLVNNADADSWVTLNQDGSFAMQVNLYVGYGTLSGTYEETGSGYKFHVKERSFSGYDGDDVDEFEMVVIGDGMLEYQGDWIGATMTGSVYQLDAPDTPAAPSNNSSVLPDGFEWVEEPSGSTRYYGSTLVEVKITGVIKNTSGSTKSVVQIKFNLYDSNGYQIGQAVDTIRDLGAGSSWKFNAIPVMVPESVARFEFASLTQW